MNLYHISQDIESGYDTYDSCVVAAASEEDARRIHPSEHRKDWPEKEDSYLGWAHKPEQVTVRLLGVAAPGIERGVICASFNAG